MCPLFKLNGNTSEELLLLGGSFIVTNRFDTPEVISVNTALCVSLNKTSLPIKSVPIYRISFRTAAGKKVIRTHGCVSHLFGAKP